MRKNFVALRLGAADHHSNSGSRQARRSISLLEVMMVIWRAPPRAPF